MKILNYNARRYPSPHGEFVLLAVLCQLEHGPYSCFAGIVRDISVEDPHYETVSKWVADNGNPLRYEDAISHFPRLPRDLYED